jgi:RNA polymerase sigma factor (sigma-70 family)
VWEALVAGWPHLDRVDDRMLAEALRAHEPGVMPHVYDGYGERLYDYCHALLRDRDSAAGALHDALVSAQAHIAKLREPERFRSWLYAIVRNECLRRLYDPARPTERHEAPEVDDAFLDPEERARLEETRQLVHSALSGLNGREREAVDLVLRHDLDDQDLAGALGMSAEQATELAGQARVALDDALAAAVIARSGRGECPSVAALVDTWEWPLTPAVCRKLIKHIEICPICRERRKRKVSTTRLLKALPVAAAPPELRQEVLTTATAADLNEERIAIAHRAEPFDVWGWPTSLDRNAHASMHKRQRSPRLWPALAAAACVMLVVGAVFLYLPHSSGKPAGNPAQGAIADSPSSPADVSPSEDEDGAADTASPTDSPTLEPPTTQPPTTRTTRPATRPTTRKPSAAQPAPPKKPKPTVTVSGCSGDPGGTCSATIRASGGTVSWSASGSGGVTASGGGTLKDGQSRTVVAHIPACGTATGPQSGAVVFSPGGSATVSWTC